MTVSIHANLGSPDQLPGHESQFDLTQIDLSSNLNLVASVAASFERLGDRFPEREFRRSIAPVTQSSHFLGKALTWAHGVVDTTSRNRDDLARNCLTLTSFFTDKAHAILNNGSRPAFENAGLIELHPVMLDCAVQLREFCNRLRSGSVGMLGMSGMVDDPKIIKAAEQHLKTIAQNALSKSAAAGVSL